MGAEEQSAQPTTAGLAGEAGPTFPVPDMLVDSTIAAERLAGAQDVVDGIARTPDLTPLPHSGELSTMTKAIFANVAGGIGRIASRLVVRTKEFVSNTAVSITPNQALRTGAFALALVPGFKGAKAVKHHMGKKSRHNTNILTHATTRFRRRQ
ncbi:MAG: hypothetical protein V4702_03395 [Patescibacteria group bacterium]